MFVKNSDLPLVFLGAGGLARELLGWMQRDHSWPRPIALLQDDAEIGQTQFGIPVLSFDAITGPVRFLVAVAPPDLKEKMVAKALNFGWIPESFVDSSSIIGLEAKIGMGCLINPMCTISSNVSLGDFVTLNCRSAIGHESVVGEYSTLLGSNQVNGGVQIEDRVLLGAGSIIHPGRKIGSRATIGIGSVVLTNISSDTVVFGNPAKILKI
jgi:acetyltransferase EpsM